MTTVTYTFKNLTTIELRFCYCSDVHQNLGKEYFVRLFFTFSVVPSFLIHF